MSTSTSRLTGALERYLPLIVLAVILLFAFFWFIQPKLTTYLASRGEVQRLEAQRQALQHTVRQGRAEPPADSAAIMRRFDSLVSPDDKVAEVVEFLVRTAAASAPEGRFRGLEVETGQAQMSAISDRGPRVAGAQTTESDPRLSLFPVSLTRTPVTITFESTFEAIAEFAWRLRNLPTLIEIRSLELTRGLPLMKASLTVFVYQRGAATTVEPPSGTSEARPPAVPRVALAMPADEGR